MKIKIEIPEILVEEIARRVVYRLEEFFRPVMDMFDAPDVDADGTLQSQFLIDPDDNIFTKKGEKRRGRPPNFSSTKDIPIFKEEKKRQEDLLRDLNKIQAMVEQEKELSKFHIRKLVAQYVALYGIAAGKKDIPALLRAKFQNRFETIGELPEEQMILRPLASALLVMLAENPHKRRVLIDG
jgi:hypothetical protein